MVRGHDHFAALRSCDADGRLYGHDVVINELAPGGLNYQTLSSRTADGVDVIESAAGAELETLGKRKDFHWMPLSLERQHVINFGPYFLGHFGLIRTGANGKPPAIAFCCIETSHYTAADRTQMLGDTVVGARPRSGTSFYKLFPRH